MSGRLHSVKSLIEKLKTVGAEKIVVNLVIACSLGAAGLAAYENVAKDIRFDDMAFMLDMRFAVAAAVIGALFILLTVLRHMFDRPRVFQTLLFVSVSAYFALLCVFGFQPFLCLFLYIFCAVAAYYSFGRDETTLRVRRPLSAARFTALAAGAAFLFFCTESCLRYANFQAEALDMGVYSQLFASLASTGKSLVTCAVSEQEYRFAAQPSPLLYPLLPLWMLAGNMYPYLVLQSAALVSGVLPLYLIMRRRQMEQAQICTVTAVYFLYPGIWCGAFYDFHEQAFLLPFVLWTLYFAEKDVAPGYLLFALLTMLTGLEGVILAIAVGLYLIAEKNRRLFGIFTLVLAGLILLLYALIAPAAATPDSAIYGNGRFFLYLLKNPMYLLKSMLNENKLIFAAFMLAGVGFLPFAAKKKSLLLLLLPMLWINLLGSDYDASVNYQHAFGVSALTLYAFAVCLPALTDKKRRMSSAFCIAACLLPFCGMVIPQANYVRDRVKNNERYRLTADCLQAVPADVSVTASSRFAAFLADRKTLYAYYPQEDGGLADMYQTEYTVLDLSDSISAETVDALLADGFEPTLIEDGALAILKNNHALTISNAEG